MTTSAEVTEKNRVIVALDQEKAYDKLTHCYLWKTLEAFNLPKLFTTTVKNLYTNAHTSVAINREFSSAYKVTRGIQQGDPLSCFLFNIGIEPLVCLIRNAQNIRGFMIPGMKEKLAINLFTDDTVLYLSEEDKYDDIIKILTKEIRRFIWEDKGHKLRLGHTYLEAPKERGGINLLNLKTRNKAIETVWLKEYLNLTNSCPTWAFITDILINETTPKHLNEDTRQNAFLQKWNIPTTGKKAKRLGIDTVRMIKVAKKHNTTFAPINLSRELREQLPTWQHIGIDKTIPQNKQAKCLAKNHKSAKI